MMITPAILLSSARCCRVACPIELATAPNTMNTRLNPRMNITEFSITERISLPSCWRSSSTPAPEISDTYPGTSSSTHGDRNEINPATNAAMGKGNDDIRCFYSIVRFFYIPSEARKPYCHLQQVCVTSMRFNDCPGSYNPAFIGGSVGLQAHE